LCKKIASDLLRKNSGGDKNEIIDLLRIKAKCLFEEGKTSASIEKLEALYNKKNSALNNIDICFDLGNIYQSESDVSNSIKYYKLGLKLLNNNKIENKLYYPKFNLKIAETIFLEKPIEAMRYLQECLLVEDFLKKEDTLLLADVYLINSRVLYQSEKIKEAWNYCKQAFKINNSTLPPIHPNLAENFNDLGILLRKKNKIEEAIKFTKKAIDIYKTRIENDLAIKPLFYAKFYNTLANHLFKNHLEDAAQANKKALELFKKVKNYKINYLSSSINFTEAYIRYKLKDELLAKYHIKESERVKKLRGFKIKKGDNFHKLKEYIKNMSKT